MCSFLVQYGAAVDLIILAPGKDGTSVGLGEYFAAGNSIDDLLSLTTPCLPQSSDTAASCEVPPTEYETTDSGIFACTPTEKGIDRYQLTNFDARVVAEVEFHDDDRVTREFEIVAKVGGKTKTVTVAAEVFDQMDWTRPKLGIRATVYDRSPRRNETLIAIQALSGPVPALMGTRKLGWHCVDGKWGRVDAGGIVSANPPAANCGLPNRPDVNPTTAKELSGGPIGPISQRIEASFRCVRTFPRF